MTQTVLLGNIVRVRRGASPRPIQNYIQNTPGIPWVKIADATSANSRFITLTKEYIKEEGRKNSVSVTPGTLIMSNSATPGLPMIMRIDASVHDGWLILDELNGVDRNWLYYYLLNRRAQSAREASGSVFSNLKTDIVRSFKIDLPDLEMQQKVAEILWTIDDKIELNKQMNETLEQMGQALFRRYFIDNPEAKKWETTTIGNFVEHIKTAINPSKLPNTIFHQYSIPSYDNSFTPEISLGSTIKSGKYQVEARSILVSKLNPATPRVWAVLKPKENAICSTEFQVIVPKEHYAFCYFLLTSNAYTDKMAMSAGGTSNSHRRVKPGDILGYPFAKPSSESLKSFEQQAFPLLETVERNQEQIHTLITLRDTLLPRLINGKIKA